MSTLWSSFNGGIGVGINVTQSPSTVTSSTSSVTLTWTIYGRNAPTWSTGSYTWSTSGAHTASGSGTGAYPASGASWAVTSFTTTLATSYTGSVSASLTASLNWPYDNGSPSVTRTVTVAKRPPATPSAPSSVSAAVSGSNVAVSWVRPSNASSAGTIWSNAVVQRQVDSYDSTSWHTVATLSGTSTSWTDTSVSGNHQYLYKVFGQNSSGTGPTVNSSWVPTAPTAPTSVTAKRSGSNIVITWVDKSPFDNGWKIEDSPDGTTWTTLSSSVPGSSTSYTHTSPSTSVTHRYRVTAHTSNGLSATSAVSNTVTLISPPSAPTGLGPAVAATGSAGPFVWTHNPTDTSDQSAFEILYSLDGGATWTDTGQVTSAVSSWDATAACAAAGTVQWQVKTWGASATAGPYSPIFTTTVSTAPTVTITNPGSTVDLSSVEVDWTYGQAEASPQSLWQVTIDDDSGNPVSFGSGSGTTASWTSGSVLADASTYTATVTVTSTAGLTATTQQAFAVAYDAPVAPTVALDDQVASGYIGVTVSTTSNGSDPDAVSLVIERQIDGGDWLILWQDNVTQVTWLDYGCTLTGVNTYRVTATSALPSSSQTVLSYQSPTLALSDMVVLSTGAGLTSVLRFSNAQSADATIGRSNVTLNQYAGRDYPVKTTGPGLSNAVSVAAKLERPADADPLEAQRDNTAAFFLGDQPTLYRDTLGRRFYCSLTPVAVPSAYRPSVTFTATQVDPGSGVVEGVTA